jgi:predicted lipoprotein with Yx(FWY)xxD motif
MRALLAIAAIGLAALGLAACGDDDSPDTAGGEGTTLEEATGEDVQGPSGSGTENEAAQQKEQPGGEIDIRDSEFGPILVDGDDRTLYLFDKEAREASECYGACAEAWPPFLTEGEPQATNGLDAGLLGTTKRDDGTTQVTYNGHPLYYYVDDPPGQVLCHNVEEFGGLWLVVTPEGEAVQ